MRTHWLRRALVAVMALVFVLAQATRTLALTTGGLHGTVTNAATHQPVVGATVTATSPSQTATVTTDKSGNFTFISLAPDTYIVSVERSGFEPSSISGVTVLADQVQNLTFPMSAALQVIGRVTSRSATDLVRPGMTADVYSITASGQAAAAPIGGGGALNQAYSSAASVPGVFYPQSQVGWGQSLYIRGGQYQQTGYEYDGVPVQRAFDNYPGVTLSALGNQEIQVYTGAAPSSAQATGLAGFINQIIKTGTYPGFGTLNGSVGAPSFYHKLGLEFGGSTPNRNFSYYVGTAGYNQDLRNIDQFNGASYGLDYSGVPAGAILANCGLPNASVGCYADGFFAGPNGFIWAPENYENNQTDNDRETIANFHFGIPHKNGGKDDIQILGDVSYLLTAFNTSAASYGSNYDSFFAGGPVTWLGTTYPNCATNGFTQPCAFAPFVAGFPFNYTSHGEYTGPVGGALTAANLTQVGSYGFPAQPQLSPLGGPVAANVNGTYNINDAIYKAQYTHQMGDNAFVRLYGYSLFSSWIENDPGVGSQLFTISPDYQVLSHTSGLGLDFEDQIGKNLIQFTSGLITSGTTRWNDGFAPAGTPVAVLVNSAAPTAGCYSAALAPVFCDGGGEAAYVLGGAGVPLAPNAGAPTLAAAPGMICGTGPCEYLTIQSGVSGEFNDVSPRFINAALSDSVALTEALQLNLGMRYDSFEYQLPSTLSPSGPLPSLAGLSVGRALMTNSYDQWNCFVGSSVANPSGIAPAVAPNTCAAGVPVTFTNTTTPANWYGGFEPRVGFTYSLNPLNVLRASYGRYLQPAPTAYQEYNLTQADIASFNVPNFYQYGFTSPQHYLPPASADNFDFSWEHQVKNSDWSWKITPFLRSTQNEAMTVIVNPVTLFSSGIPALAEHVQGIELALKKGDFNRNGFSGQLAYTYTHATAQYQTLPGGGSVWTNVNNTIGEYNAYTSACGPGGADVGKTQYGLPICGSTSTGVAAAPCYSAGGVADPACAAGDIANPYWNAPAQPLFNPNGNNYVPYNQTFSAGLSNDASSYVVPHVASLIFNYKHDRFNITPVVQFEGGGKYGLPTNEIGVDPVNPGCAPLPAGYSVTGDPRYAPGPAGWFGAASPYDAQTCGGFIGTPDPYTGAFDSLGAFTEPSMVLAHLQIGYQASPTVKLNFTVANLWGTCFGGSKEPWTVGGPKVGCWYGGQSGFQGANLYNPVGPGNPGPIFEGPNLQFPYLPVLGQINGQTVYGSALNPMQLYISAQIQL